MVNSYFRGYKILFINNEWVYQDTRQPTALTYKARGCGLCGKMATKEGHDGCLGILSGVSNACCGYGNEAEAYVQFLDMSIVRGKWATILINGLKGERL